MKKKPTAAERREIEAKEKRDRLVRVAQEIIRTRSLIGPGALAAELAWRFGGEATAYAPIVRCAFEAHDSETRSRCA